MTTNPTNRLWTYQDLAALWQVHPKTISRWVRRLRIRVLRPTQNTVRIPDSEVQRITTTNDETKKTK